MKNKAAQELGRKGGQARSEAKTVAARENAKKPRKKWVTSIAYELEGVNKAFAFGSVLVRGRPPANEGAYFTWICNKIRNEGVGLKDETDFVFTELATTSMAV